VRLDEKGNIATFARGTQAITGHRVADTVITTPSAFCRHSFFFSLLLAPLWINSFKIETH